MPGNKTAVIIGAGIGGITTAVYLAKNGYSVNIYEKNSSAGGRCSQLIRDGHRFDLGATMLLMPGIYKNIFGSLGIEFNKNGDITPLETLYRIYFDDGETLSFSTDERKMEAQLERIEPGSFKKSKQYVSKGYKFFEIALDKLIGRNFYNIFEFVNFRNINILVKLKVLLTHNSFTKRFFKHPHLRMAYTFQNIYVGQSPFNSPALFAMVPAVELKDGSFFPTGGMYSVVQKLYNAAEKSGVMFHFNMPVTRIVTNGNKAESILLDNGNEIKADIIVANADLPYVYRELLPDRRASARLGRKRYSCSAICFHWGVDKVYPQLGHHNMFLSDSYCKNLDIIFKDKLVDDKPSFYVHAPARTDADAAPFGQDTLSVVVGAGHVDKKVGQDWNKLKQITRSAVLERLKKFGLDDLEDHIKFEICYSPESWESACNISRGSVFGSLSHSIFQMGYFRPHNRHDKYKNLYFTGGSTHPGNGIPNVLLSAKLVSERILKEEKTVLS
ncbi:MAG: phytoene desaturase [Bacteroidales bacterium]|nr:phytoene desaturase [Bacteroidales bacterium]